MIISRNFRGGHALDGEQTAKLLACPDGRKLAQFEGGKRVPATIIAISDAVRWSEEIMRVIDERWPGK